MQADKRFTADMAAGKVVDVSIFIDTSRYGPTVGRVAVNGVSLNESLIRCGYAWGYDSNCKKSFCSQGEGLETQARTAGIGL